MLLHCCPENVSVIKEVERLHKSLYFPDAQLSHYAARMTRMSISVQYFMFSTLALGAFSAVRIAPSACLFVYIFFN